VEKSGMNELRCYEPMSSPLGDITLFANGESLTAIHFNGQRYETAIGNSMRRNPEHPALRAAKAQLTEYFAGKRKAFDLPLASIGTSFQRAVWQAIAGVPYGETIAYRDLARRARCAGRDPRRGRGDGAQPVGDRRSLSSDRRQRRHIDGLRGRARPQARAARARIDAGAADASRLGEPVTALRAADIARLTLLAAIWGASFIFTRALAPVLGAPLTASSRVLLAGIALIAYFRIIGFDAGLRRHWREFLVIGVLNSALPFLLFSFAALHLPASYSAILNATTPLFALLLSALWLGERLTAGRMYGLAAGVCGVALVTRAGPVEPDTMFAVAAGACLLAALSYAFAGMYIKRRATGITPMAIAGWAQFFRRRRAAAAHSRPGARRTDHADGRRDDARARAGLQRRGVPAVLPADERHRPDAHAVGHIPDSTVRDGVGCAVPERNDHAGDGRRLRADRRRHRARQPPVAGSGGRAARDDWQDVATSNG
jgi:uncharacterized membrane protein